jgi:hypothetical protein
MTSVSDYGSVTNRMFVKPPIQNVGDSECSKRNLIWLTFLDFPICNATCQGGIEPFPNSREITVNCNRRPQLGFLRPTRLEPHPAGLLRQVSYGYSIQSAMSLAKGNHHE